MPHLIDKDALVAEIDKEIKCIYAGREYVGIPLDEENRVYGLQIAKGIINTLEVKEVEDKPVSEGKDIFDNCLKSEEKFILPQKISGNINCENCLYSSACALGDIQACIIDKPVSEDLGEYINELSKQFPEVSFAKLSRIAVRVAKWQKQQDQSIIELAEDHAMLSGMEKQKELMLKDAVDGIVYGKRSDDGYIMVKSDYFNPEGRDLDYLDKIQLIIIKEEEK